MAIGFDFGTVNCSVSHVVGDQVQPIMLSEEQSYVSSTLCASNRESVTEYLYRHFNILPASEIGEQLLRAAINTNKREGIKVEKNDVRFGKQATSLYLEDPTDSYYVKSPKSFLGQLGLDEIRFAVFEDIVCAMMLNIKHRVESALEKTVDNAVIGRPVTFHNKGGEKSNQQALGILTRAAKRAGFKQVEFQYEPVAAGLEYESKLTKAKNVLVVDIGGGTSDCSLIRMGPEWVGKWERKETLLGHAGSFVGGNDLDIFLANRRFMPLFGKDTDQKSGLSVPNIPFWDCIAINNVVSQKRFYAPSNLKELKAMQNAAKQPEKLARLLEVYQHTLGYSFVAEAEKAKIALTDSCNYEATLALPTESIAVPITFEDMQQAIQTPVNKIKRLVKESIAQAETKPDEIYITGGSARSPIIRQAISSVVGDVPIASGDFMGSVTSGLARWANLCFNA